MTLAPEERQAILDGNYPSLVGMGRFEVGQVFELTSRVSVRIEKRNLARGTVKWDYTVIDNRDFYLRPTGRMLKMASSAIAAKERVKVQTEKAAAVESAYDGNPRDPLDAGLAVPPEYENVLRLQATMRHAEYRQTTAAEQAAREQARKLAAYTRDVMLQMVRAGLDTTELLASLKREVAKEETQLRDAA